jgi:DNA-binding Lrp family transcriptional regulator
MTFERVREVTDKQREVWHYYLAYACRNGFQPTITEVAARFGVTRRAIADRLVQLAVKGIVELPRAAQERCYRFIFVRFQPDVDNIFLESLPPLSAPLAQTWRFLIDFVSANGFQPNRMEMAGALGLSPAGVNYRVANLVTKGYARYTLAPAREGGPSKRRLTAERALQLPGVTYHVAFDENRWSGNAFTSGVDLCFVADELAQLQSQSTTGRWMRMRLSTPDQS